MKKQNGNFGNIVKGIFVIALLGIFSITTFSQKNHLKVSTNFGQQYSFSYERMIQSKLSIVGSFKMYNLNDNGGLFNVNNQYEQKGKRIGAETRLYFLGNKRSGTGLYIAPQLSVGNHEVKYSNTPGSGVLAGLFFSSIDFLADGDFDNKLAFKTEESTIGNANVTAMGAGLKLGYQQRLSIFTFDLGVDLTRNQILGSEKELSLSNGETKDFDNTLQGNNAALYVGVGINF